MIRLKILLFISDISNTLNEVDSEEFKGIINSLYVLAERNNDNKIIISFIDNTENRDIFMYYIRNIINDIESNNITLGYQFLGDVYYKNILNSGSILYNENNKLKQVIRYVSELEKKNHINLYYVDSNCNEELINDIFSNFDNVNLNIIKEKNHNIVNELLKNNKTYSYKNYDND